MLEYVVGRGQDGDGHHERHDGVGHGKAQRHGRQTDDDPDGHERVGQRMVRIRRKHLAFEPLRAPALVGGHPDVDGEGAHHDDERHGSHFGRVHAGHELAHRARTHLKGRQKQQHADHEACVRLELRMAVRMAVVGRTRRQRDADEAHHVAGRVEHRVDAVGLHGRRSAHQAVDVLRSGHRQVQHEDDPQHAPDGAHALRYRVLRCKRLRHARSFRRKRLRPRMQCGGIRKESPKALSILSGVGGGI